MAKEILNVWVQAIGYIGGNQREREWVERHRDKRFPTAILPWEWKDEKND